MKKFISIALCAAMLLSMAAVTAGAEEVKPTSKPKIIRTVSEKKTVKPVSRVKKPDVPEDIMEEYNYRQENAVSEEFIESLTKFGSKTSSMLLSEGEENKTYSPVSFAYALGILGSGAQDETAKEIAKALESKNMKTVTEGLNKFYNYNYSDKENQVLKIANSLWMQKDFPINEEFAKNAAKQFYASSYEVNFSKQYAADAMAKWIKDNTGGLITPSFQPDPDLVLSIINTIYFENSWANKFEAENNTTEKFTLADGTQIDAEYMNREFKGASYFETEDYTIFSIPFVNGQTMKFALPKEGKELSSILDEKTMNEILSSQDANNAKYADVSLKMPKFSFDSEFDLEETCKALGLEKLFLGKANLKGITDAGVALSSVKQESHIEVDENGCKAAAYTKMDIMKMSLPMEMEKYEFSLDRPFLFAIESTDNAPLFVGTVYNPTK